MDWTLTHRTVPHRGSSSSSSSSSSIPRRHQPSQDIDTRTATPNIMSSRAGTWVKMLLGGGAVCVGGPALVMWLQPTDEELFQRYSPDLQRKSLERRHERQREFDDFVGQLKEHSKSNKPIWTVQADEANRQREEAERRTRQEARQAESAVAEEVRARREQMRREAGLPSSSSGT
ncbi:CBP4-domain-containing protein [Xylariaceae sp. FL0804]|nr:CBP4-domain-containing protein [Xylariaceae sp. FL0804]